jgi:lysozyme family protein
MNFEQAYEKLLGHEKGYSNHPADKGGPTNWGVTQKVARANGYQGDMRDFPQALAHAIYRKDYWTPCQADALPAGVRYDVFDGAVNSGVGQSVRWLQRAAGAEADGAVGPATLRAVNALPGAVLAARFNGHRLMFMAGLSNWDSFSEGWAKRIATNLLGVA